MQPKFDCLCTSAKFEQRINQRHNLRFQLNLEFILTAWTGQVQHDWLETRPLAMVGGELGDGGEDAFVTARDQT